MTKEQLATNVFMNIWDFLQAVILARGLCQSAHLMSAESGLTLHWKLESFRYMCLVQKIFMKTFVGSLHILFTFEVKSKWRCIIRHSIAKPKKDKE